MKTRKLTDAETAELMRLKEAAWQRQLREFAEAHRTGQLKVVPRPAKKKRPGRGAE